jgi:hypothetical protein
VTLTVRSGPDAQRSVEIAYQRVGPRGPFVVGEITLDGESLLVSECGKKKSGLCSAAHQDLRGSSPPGPKAKDSHGKGAHLQLVAVERFDDRAFALFSSGTWGSPECGTYAYWILRLDAKGTRVTEPLEGCFFSPVPEGEPGGPMPMISWGDPPLLWLGSPGLMAPRVAIYSLDEASMALRLEAKSRDRP